MFILQVRSVVSPNCFGEKVCKLHRETDPAPEARRGRAADRPAPVHGVGLSRVPGQRDPARLQAKVRGNTRLQQTQRFQFFCIEAKVLYLLILLKVPVWFIVTRERGGLESSFYWTTIYGNHCSTGLQYTIIIVLLDYNIR